MNVHRTKTFRSGNSEAVRLPKDIGFGLDTEVEIARNGDEVVIRRVGSNAQELVRRLRALPRPSYVEVRDTEEIPERPGL
jgi:antitoxin VapB